ncbi:MAG: oxidoreductase [Solirubrobacteraceae bacterium]|nr:oxidoreductase [Solirubrobacteraceae bacterium]
MNAHLGSDLDDDRPLVVTEREDLAPGIIGLRLEDPAGSPLPLWQPGSHVDLVLGEDLVKQYSLCGDPADRTGYRVAVLREDGGAGGSVLVHDTLVPGAPVAIRGPRNHFAFEIAPRYRFIAGGIGITAILPMVRAAAAAGADWTLDYCGKSVDAMAFAGELAGAFPEQVRLHASRETGRLDVQAALAAPDPVTDVYCCGPESLMGAVEQAADQAGWLPGALHLERFVPRELGEVVWQQPFDVDLLLTGKTVTVPLGTSILQAARDAGALVLSSCETGTCATCETPVLEGAVDHRDSVLTPHEQAAGDRMMICVSRAACSRLVLEL